MKLHEKLCEQCKKPFFTNRSTQKYCTYKCYIDTTNLTLGDRLAAVYKQKGYVESQRMYKQLKKDFDRGRI